MSDSTTTRKIQHCPACGGTIRTEPYRALDSSAWCQHCANDACNEAETNYALELALARVDLHAVVLDLLRQAEERKSLGWRRYS